MKNIPVRNVMVSRDAQDLAKDSAQDPVYDCVQDVAEKLAQKLQKYSKTQHTNLYNTLRETLPMFLRIMKSGQPKLRWSGDQGCLLEIRSHLVLQESSQ